MSKLEITVHSKPDCMITLLHYPEDPLTWIVRKWKRQFFWKKRIISRWFATREQAEQYADQLARDCDRGTGKR